MPTNYLPSREAQLVTWSRNFGALIGAEPDTYGLTAAQATEYATVQDQFDSSYQTANDPATRSPTNVQIKNDAKRAFIAYTRDLVNIIQAAPGTTDAMRSALGITIPDPSPTPVPVPDSAPVLTVESVVGHTFKIKLGNVSGSRRRPTGVIGASIFSYVGETPPTDINGWIFQGSTRLTDTDVPLSTDIEPGTKVWFTAFWYNRRSESGQASEPVSTHIGFGGVATNNAA